MGVSADFCKGARMGAVSLLLLASGLLGRETPLPQPSGEVVRMEVDPPLLLDDLGQTWGGPQLGGEAMLGRALGQPATNDLLLGGRQFGGPSGHGSCRQTGGPLPLEGCNPTANAARIDTKEVRDLRGGVAVEDAFDGETPTVFQLCR